MAEVDCSTYLALAVPDRLTQLLADGDAAIAMAERTGDPMLEFWTVAFRSAAVEWAGDRAG